MKHPVMRSLLLASALAIALPAYSFNFDSSFASLSTGGGWSLADFWNWLLQQIGTWTGGGGGSTGQPVPVSEPGVSLLLLTTLAGIAIYRLRRRH